MSSNNSTPNNEWIRLNVGGKIFETTQGTLSTHPESFLARLTNGNISSEKDESGAFFIDRDYEHFRTILNYFRNGVVNLDRNEKAMKDILCEADFYNIQPLVDEIQKTMRSVTNRTEMVIVSKDSGNTDIDGQNVSYIGWLSMSEQDKGNQTMHNLELSLCTSPQNSQSTKGHNKIKQICLRIPGNHLDSLRKQFGSFIVSEEPSETSESSSLEWFSPFSDEESVREIKSNRDVISKRMSATTKLLLSGINSKYALRHLSSSDSENEKLIAQKANRMSKVTKAVTKDVEISARNPTRKKTQIGSFVFSDSSSDGSFVEIRKGYMSSKTVSALPEDRAQVIKLNQENVRLTKKPEETHSPPISDIDKELSKQMPASVIIENKQHKASMASDLVLAEPITDASSWFSDSQNAKLPGPKKMIGLIKSVTREPTSNKNNKDAASTSVNSTQDIQTGNVAIVKATETSVLVANYEEFDEDYCGYSFMKDSDSPKKAKTPGKNKPRNIHIRLGTKVDKYVRDLNGK